MNIINDSKKILSGIYGLLNEDSYCLVVKIPYNDFAEKYNMTRQHLNLCIHYLIEAGYIKGDFVFNNNKDAIKEVTVLPNAIRCEENLNFGI